MNRYCVKIVDSPILTFSSSDGIPSFEYRVSDDSKETEIHDI